MHYFFRILNLKFDLFLFDFFSRIFFDGQNISDKNAKNKYLEKGKLKI